MITKKIKNPFILPALLLSLLIILLTVACFLVIPSFIKDYITYQERETAHYHLFCEVVRPGMLKDEVFRILEQAGEFQVKTVYMQYDETPTVLEVVFTDPKGKQLVGYLFLFDDRYDSANKLGFGTYETVCNSSQPTQLATAPP